MEQISDEKTILGLERTLFSLHPNAETIYKAIVAIRSNNQVRVSGEKQEFTFTIRYDKKAPATWKIKFAISHLGRFSKASEILELIKHYEPSFKIGLSTPLTALKENFELVLIKPSGSKREVYYGFNKWIDSNGQIVNERMYEKQKDIIE